MTDRGGRVICLGVACLDELLLFEDTSLPVRDSRVKQRGFQGGGMAATAAVTVVRLGGRAEYWGAVGDDWAGERILGDLDAAGVDVSQAVRVGGCPGPVSLVAVDGRTGERHFLRFEGHPRPPNPLGDPARLRDAACLLIDGYEPASALRAAAAARELGVPVVADFERRHADLEEMLRLTDCAIVSRELAGSFAPDPTAACERIRAMGPTCAGVTLGERGVVCVGPAGRLEQPGFAVNPVDTTGAGDVFHGAFCWGLSRGLDLPENLRFASATAAMKCRRLGGRAGIPTCAEVLAFLRGRGVPVPSPLDPL